MTDEEIEASRASIKKLQGYRKGSMPSLPRSLPQFIQDELGRKISPTIENLIIIIKALNERLSDVEEQPAGGGSTSPTTPTDPSVPMGGGNATSGWRRTSDGYVEQWGRCRNFDYVTFPVPFVEDVSFISGTCINTGNTDDWVGFTFHTYALSLTGFGARATYQARYDAGPPGETFAWYARGR